MAGTGLTLDPEFYRRFGGAEEASSAGTGYMLAVYLAPRGQAPGIGPESGSETPPTDGIARYDSPHGSVRYVLYKDSRALAALQVVTRDGKHAQIANAYVEPRWRRHGFATELLDRARADFTSVVHSKDMSPDAKKWKARVGEAPRKTALTPADCSHIQQWLFDYLSTDIDPYDFGEQVKQWIEQEEIEGVEAGADAYTEDLTADQVKQFKKWLKKSGIIEDQLEADPYGSPAYLMLHAKTKMPAGSWFVHFTRERFDRFAQGSQLDGLHLSTWKKRKELVNCSNNLLDTQGIGDVVFGFAFDASDLKMNALREGASTYGRHMLLFQCDCAVEAYHDGDEEYQNIFPLCSEYNLHHVELGIADSEVDLELENGDTTSFRTLQDVIAHLETKPKHRRTRVAEEAGGIIPVDHRAVEEAAKRVASQFAHHLLSLDLDGRPLVWMFEHADNKMKVRDQLVTNGPPEVEFGYFTPFKFGTMKTVRGHDLIDKIMIHPVLVWREDSKDLILGAATRGVAFTGYASIWVRVNVASPYAKELRDHPGNFTRQFSSVLLHEVTHIRDFIRQQDIVDPEKYRDKPGAGYDAFVKYVNSPHELRAYSSQIVYEVLNVLQHGGYISKKLRERAELRRDNPNEWLIEQALERSHTWNQKQGAMYPESRARVLRAVYRALEREGLLVVQGAPRLPRTAAEAHHERSRQRRRAT